MKDSNCVAWRLKLTGKKELLEDEEEDAQVAIEMTEIPEGKVYEWIQADLDKLWRTNRKY